MFAAEKGHPQDGFRQELDVEKNLAQRRHGAKKK